MFFLGFDFAMVNMLNYNQLFEYDNYILCQSLVVVAHSFIRKSFGLSLLPTSC